MDPNCPWNPKPKLPMGDADERDTYAAVGHALSRWECLETSIALCFSAIVGALMNQSAMRAYGTVASFSGRRDMVKAAFDVFELRDHPKVAPFAPLLNRAGNFSARRNEIAHGVVTRVTVDNVPQGSYLVPPRYNSNKHKYREPISMLGLGDYAYTAAQIHEYAQHFHDLHIEASRLSVDIRVLIDPSKVIGGSS